MTDILSSAEKERINRRLAFDVWGPHFSLDCFPFICVPNRQI